MSKANLKLCPSCLLEIIGGDEVTTCPDCGVTYHKSCWEIEKQCKDDQCPGVIKKKAEAMAMRAFCGKCGTALKPTQEFCPKCGTPRPSKKPAGVVSNAVIHDGGTSAQTAAEKEPSAPLPKDSDASTVPEVTSPPAAVKRFCGNCGFELKSGQQFCGRCGRPTTNNSK